MEPIDEFQFVRNRKFQSCGEIESNRRFEVYVEMKAEDYPSFSIDNKKVMCYLK